MHITTHSSAKARGLAVDGVVHRRHLEAAGVADALGDRRVRRGEWQRLAPSLWLTGTDPATDRQLVRAAFEHAGHDCVVTGLLACRALGLPYAPADGFIDALVPAHRRRSGSGVVRVMPTERMPVPPWSLGPVGMASAERSVVDAARRLDDLRSVRALVLAALQSGRCGLTEVIAEVAAGPSAGSALMRRAVADFVRGAWSAPEAEVADVALPALAAAGFREVLLNPSVFIDGQFLCLVDGWITGLGIAWEVDSREHHGDGDTLARHTAAARHGALLMHVTPRRFRAAPGLWTAELVETAVARGRLSMPEPAGLVVVPADLWARQRARLQRGG